MIAQKEASDWGMVEDRPEAQTTKSKSSTNSNDSTASREPDGHSLREALDRGLENAASKPATPTPDDTLREALDIGLTNATAGSADSQRQEDEDRKQKIRVKNRRRIYLDSHPDYFSNPDLELADPLLYDRCIRRFQSAAEREADGKRKGYSGVMEADLWRSEAKLAALAEKELCRDFNEDEGDDSAGRQDDEWKKREESGFKYVSDKDGNVLPEDEDEVPKSKEEGEERWREATACRFVQGKDEDFDYGPIDQDDSFDVEERREAEEKWFEEEEPEWANGAKENGRSEMETGIQDF